VLVGSACAASPSCSSLTPLPESLFLAELTSLATASSTVDSKAIADSIALSLRKSPGVLEATQNAKIIDVVLMSFGSKSGYGRESAPVLLERIFKSLDAGIESVIPLVPALWVWQRIRASRTRAL
jgi:hypothetical protein